MGQSLSSALSLTLGVPLLFLGPHYLCQADLCLPFIISLPRKEEQGQRHFRWHLKHFTDKKRNTSIKAVDTMPQRSSETHGPLHGEIETLA